MINKKLRKHKIYINKFKKKIVCKKLIVKLEFKIQKNKFLKSKLDCNFIYCFIMNTFTPKTYSRPTEVFFSRKEKCLYNLQYTYIILKVIMTLKIILNVYTEIQNLFTQNNSILVNKYEILKLNILNKQSQYKKKKNILSNHIIFINWVENYIYIFFMYNINKKRFFLNYKDRIFFILPLNNIYNKKIFAILNEKVFIKKNNLFIKMSQILNYKYVSSYLYNRKLNFITNIILYYIFIQFKALPLRNIKKLFKIKNILNKKNKNQLLPSRINYLFNLLEEDYNLYLKENITDNSSNKINTLTPILNLRNMLFSVWNKRIERLKKTSFLLTNSKYISDFKLLQLKKTLLNFLELNSKSTLLYKGNIKHKKTVKISKYKGKQKKSILNYIFKLQKTRIIFQNQHYNYIKNKELISLLFGFPIQVYYINALSITRFEYQLNIHIHKKYIVLNKKKSSEIFITKLEREFIRRYKFIANYLQDFTRIGFLSFFTKNLSFLMRFIAFQISKLQKNRKETQLIRFIIKALKIFSAQRPEVIALKVQFKGRVNRWRRTKIITGKRGYIPFYSYKTRLEYATATSITRKGTLGIRFWLYYNLFQTKQIGYALTQYLNYTTLFNQIHHRKLSLNTLNKQKDLKLKK